MAIKLLKSFAHNESTAPSLNSMQLEALLSCYSQVVKNMQRELIAGIGDAFLELFEDEIRTFKRMTSSLSCAPLDHSLTGSTATSF